MPPRKPATFWIRQYRWRSVQTPGFELVDFGERANGTDARGMIISEADGVAFGAVYHIRLRQDGTFEGLNLQLLDGRKLTLRSDGKGRWTENDGAPRPDLVDCIDIDLSGSPFTNNLPIRRTRFAIGTPEDFTMAFVALDSLSVTPHEQTYTRLDDDRFRYHSKTTGFQSDLIVDSEGVVLTYPGLFERVEN